MAIIPVSDIDSCFIDAIGMLAEHAPAGRIAAQDGVRIAATGAGGREFNLVHILEPPEDEATLDWAIDLLDQSSPQWMLQLRAEHVPHLAEALAARGLKFQDALPVMLADVPASLPELPDGLRLEEVRDPVQLRANTEAAAVGFGAPSADGLHPVFPPSLLSDNRIVLFNGWVDDAAHPQATAAAAVRGSLVGVFSITAHPSVRRRGIGAAMTWAAMASGARRGASHAVLQASPMGEPVYRAMGFTTVGHHHRFARGAETEAT